MNFGRMSTIAIKRRENSVLPGETTCPYAEDCCMWNNQFTSARYYIKPSGVPPSIACQWQNSNMPGYRCSQKHALACPPGLIQPKTPRMSRLRDAGVTSSPSRAGLCYSGQCGQDRTRSQGLGFCSTIVTSVLSLYILLVHLMLAISQHLSKLGSSRSFIPLAIS